MTPGEPQSATNYDDRTTAAVKKVLVEIGQILGSFKGKFAIVGGAVPWLLLGNEAIMADRPHPEQGYRSCLGLLRLGKAYGTDRLEAACRRAMGAGATSYRHVKSILTHDLDRQPLLPDEGATVAPLLHANIRGPHYYLDPEGDQ